MTAIRELSVGQKNINPYPLLLIYWWTRGMGGYCLKIWFPVTAMRELSVGQKEHWYTSAWFGVWGLSFGGWDLGLGVESLGSRV